MNAKKIRESQNKTQREVAIATGLTERTIARLEAGESLSGRTLKAIADFYGVTIDELLGRKIPSSS